LVQVTGGHPGLLRAVSSAVVAAGLNPLASADDWVKQLLTRDDIQYRCRKMWQELTLAQQRALHGLSTGRSEAVTPASLTQVKELGLVQRRGRRAQLCSPILAGFAAAQLGFVDLVSVSIIDGKVFQGEKEIALRPMEQKLLDYFLNRPHQVCSHDQIAQAVWETAEVTPEMIAGVVSQLRRKLGKAYIRTYHRRGYAFVS
jgi:hypothetical protein